jgi:hypothetical protein
MERARVRRHGLGRLPANSSVSDASTAPASSMGNTTHSVPSSTAFGRDDSSTAMRSASTRTAVADLGSTASVSGGGPAGAL